MKIWLIITLVVLAVAGCSRRETSEDPPVHLVQNMDEQPKVKQQSESRYYADGLAMRTPIEGTVARGWLRYDSARYYDGLDSKGGFVEQNPHDATVGLIARGEERYAIFCVPCHGIVADGHSIMVEKKMPAPPSFHEYRLRDSVDGYLYHVITNGFGNMPPYKYQIRAEDRWAIAAYIRALQASHPPVPNTTLETRQGATDKP